jgi:hypothetical protein
VKLADPKAASGIPVATPGRTRWRIGCSDVIGRPRDLTVVVEHGRGVLIGPPGETVILSLQQADQLRVALREAVARAGG